MTVNAGMNDGGVLLRLDSPTPLGSIDASRRFPAERQKGCNMLELSLWVLGGVFVMGLLACRLARKPRKQHDMELLDFDFDKSKTYEKDGRKYPFSY